MQLNYFVTDKILIFAEVSQSFNACRIMNLQLHGCRYNISYGVSYNQRPLYTYTVAGAMLLWQMRVSV